VKVNRGGTRIEENIYRYESDSGFSAEIMVDDLGLVTTYPGGWERIKRPKTSTPKSQ
jgi:hypothetical protein